MSGGYCHGARASPGGYCIRERTQPMQSGKLRTLTWCLSVWFIGSTAWRAAAQQRTPSDLAVARQGAIPLAAAHGEKPRYGGTFLSAGNEEIPFYDPHQTSLVGCMPRSPRPTTASSAPAPTTLWVWTSFPSWPRAGRVAMVGKR